MGLDGIFRFCSEGLDFKVLFYPFEKKFYFPSMLVKSGLYGVFINSEDSMYSKL